MSFLNNLGQKISDVSQTTIKKTKDLADTAKLNLNISEEERKIDTAYEQIGKWYVEKHREDAEEDVKTWLDAIAVSEARIKECRESIHQMKGVAICPSCGASVDADAAFCSACGQKMPEKPKRLKTDIENKRSCRAADIRWCDSSFSNFIKTSCAISTVYINGL